MKSIEDYPIPWTDYHNNSPHLSDTQKNSIIRIQCTKFEQEKGALIDMLRHVLSSGHDGPLPDYVREQATSLLNEVDY